MDSLLSCPICLEIFSSPVTLTCGHSFCRSCINQAFQSKFHCPFCRHLVPNVNSIQINQQLQSLANLHKIPSNTPTLPKIIDLSKSLTLDLQYKEFLLFPHTSVLIDFRISSSELSFFWESIKDESYFVARFIHPKVSQLGVLCFLQEIVALELSNYYRFRLKVLQIVRILSETHFQGQKLLNCRALNQNPQSQGHQENRQSDEQINQDRPKNHAEDEVPQFETQIESATTTFSNQFLNDISKNSENPTSFEQKTLNDKEIILQYKECLRKITHLCNSLDKFVEQQSQLTKFSTFREDEQNLEKISEFSFLVCGLVKFSVQEKVELLLRAENLEQRLLILNQFLQKFQKINQIDHIFQLTEQLQPPKNSSFSVFILLEIILLGIILGLIFQKFRTINNK